MATCLSSFSGEVVAPITSPLHAGMLASNANVGTILTGIPAIVLGVKARKTASKGGQMRATVGIVAGAVFSVVILGRAVVGTKHDAAAITAAAPAAAPAASPGPTGHVATDANDDGAREVAAQGRKKAASAQAAAERKDTVASYPAPCAEVDAATHVPLKGDPDNCIPRFEGVLAVALSNNERYLSKLPDSPGSYSDESPIAVFLGPNSSAEEKSALSAGEREALAAKTRSKLYYRLESNWGDWNWVGAAGKLSGDLDLGGSSLTTGEPNVQRKQKCEDSPGVTCGQRCEDDGDCSRIFSLCGCSESQCTIFGRCTECPSLHICEDVTFDLSVPHFKVSTTFSTPEGKAAGEAAAQRAYVLMLTRVTGAWRRVFTKSDKGYDDKPVRSVEHDTGHITRIAPTGLFVMTCQTPACGRSATQVAAFNAQPWSLELDHRGGKAKVSCSGGICSGSFAEPN